MLDRCFRPACSCVTSAMANPTPRIAAQSAGEPRRRANMQVALRERYFDAVFAQHARHLAIDFVLDTQSLVNRVDVRPDLEVQRAFSEGHEEHGRSRVLQNIRIASHCIEDHPLCERRCRFRKRRRP